MTDIQATAMQCAVLLALSGKHAEWRAVGEQLGAEGYRQSDLDWTTCQRTWLDQLCNAVRAAQERAALSQPPRQRRAQSHA